MSVEIEGFDEFEGELGDLVDRLERIGGELPMTDLYPPVFMRTYTEFGCFRAFMDASPWLIESAEDFDSIPSIAFDRYVSEHTDFASWDAMLRVAGREYVLRQIATR